MADDDNEVPHAAPDSSANAFNKVVADIAADVAKSQQKPERDDGKENYFHVGALVGSKDNTAGNPNAGRQYGLVIRSQEQFEEFKKLNAKSDHPIPNDTLKELEKLTQQMPKTNEEARVADTKPNANSPEALVIALEGPDTAHLTARRAYIGMMSREGLDGAGLPDRGIISAHHTLKLDGSALPQNIQGHAPQFRLMNNNTELDNQDQDQVKDMFKNLDKFGMSAPRASATFAVADHQGDPTPGSSIPTMPGASRRI